MTRAEVIELIRNGENSGVEFKRDDVSAATLASEMVAFLNLRGGRILLGVEEDGTVSGLTRDRRKAEERVMEAARVRIQPATIPYWETVRWDPGRIVGIVSLSEDAPDKPYKVKRGSAWVTKVRVGTTARDVTRKEEARLYQQSGRIEYGLKPVQGAEAATLDHRRLRDYFGHVLGWGPPGDPESGECATQLVNLDLAVRRHARTAPTVNGVLLFGDRRVDRWEYPKSVVREAVTNALVHRDYSIAGTDITLTIYSNRLEVTSPGRLPNTVTPEGMRSGMRYARNQALVNVMRDYGYVDARGMGVRMKMIPGMREHNGTEPDLIEDEHRFTVRLWK